MIDWKNLAANALWILGCAIALATMSYASWEASQYHEKMGARLKRPAYQACLNLAGLLFCLGLAATSGVLLQRAIWLVLAAAFAVMLTFSLYPRQPA